MSEDNVRGVELIDIFAGSRSGATLCLVETRSRSRVRDNGERTKVRCTGQAAAGSRRRDERINFEKTARTASENCMFIERRRRGGVRPREEIGVEHVQDHD